MNNQSFNPDPTQTLQKSIDNLRLALLQVVTHSDLSDQTKWFLNDLVKEILLSAEGNEGNPDLEAAPLRIDSVVKSRMSDALHDKVRGD
jgi:hypothetical protein